MIRKATTRYAQICHWLCEGPGRLFEFFVIGLEAWWLVVFAFAGKAIESNPSYDAFSFLPGGIWILAFAGLAGTKVLGWLRPQCVRIRYFSAVGSVAIWAVVARNFWHSGSHPTGAGAYTLVTLACIVLASRFLAEDWSRGKAF